MSTLYNLLSVFPTNPPRFLLLTGFFLSLFNCSSNTPEQAAEQLSFTPHLVGPFSVALPVTWKPMDMATAKSGQGIPDLYGFQPVCAKDAAFCENVVIRLTVPTAGVPLAAIGTALEEALQKKYTGYVLHSRRDTTMHHLPLTILDYEFTAHDLRLRSTAVLAQTTGYMAQFGFASLHAPGATDARHQLLLQTIIASIRVR